MDRSKKFEKRNIEKIITENFIKLMPAFYEMQSLFLSGVYKRYGDLEGGHIVILFARDLHLEILRKREKDLDFNLSLDEFWNNHKDVVQSKKKIILISRNTGLPKETTRRKIISLIKKKHLRKEDRNRIWWEPAIELKNTYIKTIEEEINSLAKFIYEHGKIANANLSFPKIEKEIKNNYSFYWYHFLNFQLSYFRFWQNYFKDLEIILIGIQVLIQTITFLSSKISGDINFFINNKLPKNIDVKHANISATSISDITGIPRATCIRKLDRLVKMNLVFKDKDTKRYYLLMSQISANPTLVSGENTKNMISLFSEFSSIVLRALVR